MSESGGEQPNPPARADTEPVAPDSVVVPEPVIPPEPEPEPAETEADKAPEGEVAPPRPSRWPIAVAAALLVVGTFLGVLAAQYKAELDRERGRRQDVEEVAARFAANFVTYDYRTLDESLERIRDDATAKFGNEYERLFRSSVSTLITETKAQSRGTVTDVFLGELDDEAANVLTVLNVERQGISGRVPVAGTYLELDLVRSGGRWKIDNVTAINFTQSGPSAPTPGGPTAPGATTTTSAAG